MDFLFLPPVYIITLIVSAVVTGIIFDGISGKHAIIVAGALFGIFSVSQLIFRVLLHEMPERLAGQIIYFMLFLVITYATNRAKQTLIG